MAEEFTADIPAQGPWLKYQKPSAPAADGPWTKYQQPAGGGDKPSTAAPGGFFTGFLNGIMHGAGNVLHGGARIGARMGAAPEIGQTEPSFSPERVKQVDETAASREKAYQADPTRKAHPIASGLGEIGGEALATAPMMAPLAGSGAIPSLAGRLGASAAIGAGASLATPRGGESMSPDAQLKRGAIGAAGGAVAGAAAEGVGSLLGRAIASNDPNAVTAAFRRTVKPSRTGQASASQLQTQDNRILTAVDQIIAASPPGQYPKSLREFADAIDNAKGPIFQKFDAMAQAAGGEGAKVDLAPVVKELRSVAERPEIVDFHPDLAREAEQLAMNFERRGVYSASEAQGVIKNLNETLKGFYKNPTKDTVSRASLLGPVARILRENLDSAITASQGPGYQVLKNQYGALTSIEKDVAGAVQREANKIPGGLGGIFMDAASSEEFLRGIVTLNPGALVRAGGIKAAQKALQHVNSPNRAIARLFAARAAGSSGPLSSALGTAGAALRPLGDIAGGQAATLEFPAMPAPR